jgi:hypothetical protein
VNDWLWIAPLIYFVLSAMGNSAAKKAKEAAQKARREKSQQAAGLPDMRAPAEEAGVDRIPLDAPVTQAVPAPSGPAKRSADDIAAEIRRMMGLPPEAVTEPESEQSLEDDFAEPEAEPVVEEARVTNHGGDLHERLRAREAEGRHSAGLLENRRLEDRESALVNRHSWPSFGGSARKTPLAGASLARRSYVGTEDMARAIVTAEILGPPKALRPEEW